MNLTSSIINNLYLKNCFAFLSIVPSFLIKTFSVEAFSVLTTETVHLFSTSEVPVVFEGTTIVFTVSPFAI